jgi:hypothetical protein
VPKRFWPTSLDSGPFLNATRRDAYEELLGSFIAYIARLFGTLQIIYLEKVDESTSGYGHKPIRSNWYTGIAILEGNPYQRTMPTTKLQSNSS